MNTSFAAFIQFVSSIYGTSYFAVNCQGVLVAPFSSTAEHENEKWYFRRCLFNSSESKMKVSLSFYQLCHWIKWTHGQFPIFFAEGPWVRLVLWGLNYAPVYQQPCTHGILARFCEIYRMQYSYARRWKICIRLSMYLIKSKPVTYVSLISFYKLSLICMFVVDLIYKFFNLVKAKHNIQISIYCTQFISSIIKIELR